MPGSVALPTTVPKLMLAMYIVWRVCMSTTNEMLRVSAQATA
jgi:hypothetical protein